jgi:hypothetical protein
VDLDAVEAGLESALGAGAELLDDGGDLAQLECVRHEKGGPAVHRVRLAVGVSAQRNRRRLEDNEASLGRTLRVVLDHQVAGISPGSERMRVSGAMTTRCDSS